MARMGSAHEADSNITWPRFPGLLQEVFQWKPKPKGRKQKSQIDDTRTEISYSASTGVGEADFETSTYVSKDLGTPSSRSVESKRSKKRSKKSLKDTSGSVYSEAASSSPTTPEPSKEASSKPSYLVTLNCPLCNDPDCILNKAAQCPLLRHNEQQTPDCCSFCRTNCQCEENKKKFPPVSGLVQRDENGIAVTLLKVNGGPIENSNEWANRRHWDVPSHVRWEHKISEWVTAPIIGNTKAEEGSHRKKSHKKSKRKSKVTQSALTATPDIVSNSEERRIEEDEQETKLILEGNGFKIFAKGHEKILINYDRKNCKYMGCSCIPVVDSIINCGCRNLRAGGEKPPTKHHKNCPNRPQKISLLKETSHGMETIHKELEAKYAKEKRKSSDSAVLEKPGICDKYDDSSSNQKLKKVGADKKEEQRPKHEKHKEGKGHLTGKDVRNQSRAAILESSLRNILGDDYKNGDDTEKTICTENLQAELCISVPCPAGLDQSGVIPFGGNCICAHDCCYATYQ